MKSSVLKLLPYLFSLSLFLPSCAQDDQTPLLTRSNPVPTTRTAQHPTISTPNWGLPYEVGNRFRMDNLEVFFLTGNPENQESYVTLDQAMEKEYVKVKETGQVNQLQINNLSDHYIFIHSGDIVKGGKQDRTLSKDVIIPPHARKVNLASFCVESARWTNRGEEAVTHFQSNNCMLSSRDLKVSSKYRQDQGKVWEKVSEGMNEINNGLAVKYGYYSVNVSDSASATSLQLALENDTLNKVREEMIQYFTDRLMESEQVVGFGYAINGEVYEINTYNNQQLFQDLWPKLIASAVTESISDFDIMDSLQTEKMLSLNQLDSLQWISPTDPEKVNDITRLETQTSGDEAVLLFTTSDNRFADQWLHQNLLCRSEEEMKSISHGGPAFQNSNAPIDSIQWNDFPSMRQSR
ncbi:hypothetical protein KFE98_05345 [bacterium SCSIO 12741]|nr:hypothetical protein KFE98_05345 [bacterium SCSIO 12741]